MGDRPFWYPKGPSESTTPGAIPTTGATREGAKMPGLVAGNPLPNMQLEDYLIGEILRQHDPGPPTALLRSSSAPLAYQQAKTIYGTNPRNRPMRGQYRGRDPWIYAERGRPNSSKYPDYYGKAYGMHVMTPDFNKKPEPEE